MSDIATNALANIQAIARDLAEHPNHCVVVEVTTDGHTVAAGVANLLRTAQQCSRKMLAEGEGELRPRPRVGPLAWLGW